MKSPTSIMIKFASASRAVLESVKKDSRVATVSGMSGGGWFFFELDDASATKGASAGSAALTKPPKSSRRLTADRIFTSLLEWDHWGAVRW